MISERIFDEKVSIEEITYMILEQRIDIILQRLYAENKVNTATSSVPVKEDVV
jgi:hypothetical protein